MQGSHRELVSSSIVSSSEYDAHAQRALSPLLQWCLQVNMMPIHNEPSAPHLQWFLQVSMMPTHNEPSAPRAVHSRLKREKFATMHPGPSLLRTQLLPSRDFTTYLRRSSIIITLHDPGAPYHDKIVGYTKYRTPQPLPRRHSYRAPSSLPRSV